MRANGSRVKQVRELDGYTQIDFADAISIKQSTLAKIESGRDDPSEDVVHRIASLSGFSPEFFVRPDTVEFPMGSLLFRSHSSISARMRTEAYRHAQLLFELWEDLAPKLNEIKVKVPTNFSADPLFAAKMARAQLGFSPDTPISRLIYSLEKAGVIVFALAAPLEKRDGFSLWAGADSKKPVIALCADRPGDRQYWSASHELGHLILHNRIQASIQDLEAEADQFAAEFLLPERAMRHELRAPISLSFLAQLKIRWNVSMQALVRRARELDVITERQYRYLFEQIGMRGWRLKEPEQLRTPFEKPRAFRKALELLYGNPIDLDHLARETAIGTKRLSQMIEAHAVNLTLPRSKVARFPAPSWKRTDPEHSNLVELRSTKAREHR